MWYNSWEPRRTARRSAASRKLRCYTDPLTYALHRREPSSSNWSSSHDGASTCPSNNTSLDKKISRKRKSPTAAPEEGPSKCRRESPDSAEGIINILSGCVSDRLATSGDQAMFETKYRTEKQLGAGSFGTVYSGYRREDNLPVAIKYIPPAIVEYIEVPVDGEIRKVPLEAALLCKATPAASETSSAVALLDWYDVKEYVILVMERPVPCCDLFNYVYARRSAMSEQEAKVITKQLLDAGIELHSRGVFHRDIKLDNLLIEFGSDVPRIRIIDFGCSKFILGKTCPAQQETNVDASLQHFTELEHEAEQKTAWQIGFAISEMLLMYRANLEDLSSDCQDFVRRFQLRKNCVSLTSLRDHPWLV